MNYILFDEPVARRALLPFTHTRPVADIRCGVFTMRERWQKLLGQATGTWTEPYLQTVFPLSAAEDNIWINGAVFATLELAGSLQSLPPGHKLLQEGSLLAFRTGPTEIS